MAVPPWLVHTNPYQVRAKIQARLHAGLCALVMETPSSTAMSSAQLLEGSLSHCPTITVPAHPAAEHTNATATCSSSRRVIGPMLGGWSSNYDASAQPTLQ
jgi:hypothetical protein